MVEVSLREKILEQAKTLVQLNRTCHYLELSRFCRDCLGDCEFVGTDTFLGKWVSVGEISDLLDKATEQINEKLSVSRKYIHIDDPWARRQARAEVNILEWVLTVLGVGEGKQK